MEETRLFLLCNENERKKKESYNGCMIYTLSFQFLLGRILSSLCRSMKISILDLVQIVTNFDLLSIPNQSVKLVQSYKQVGTCKQK